MSGKSRRSVVRGSTAYDMLHYALYFPFAKAAHYNCCFNKGVRSYNHKTIKRLLDDGYLAISPKVKDGIILTVKGWDYLDEKTDATESLNFAEYRNLSGEPRELERLSQTSEIGMTLTAGGVMAAAKPPLEKLVAALEQHDYIEPSTQYKDNPLAFSEIEKVLGALEQGIFYTADEVHEYFQKYNMDEVLYSCRYRGILLTTERIYVIYYTGNNLILSYEAREASLASYVTGLFSRFKNYTAYAPGAMGRMASAIIFGDSTNVTAALTTGYTWGCYKENKRNPKFKLQLHLLSANFDIYDEMYCVSLKHEGPAMVQYIISHTTADTLNDARSFAAEAPDKYTLLSGDELQSVASLANSNVILAYLPCLETKLLRRMKDSKAYWHIVTEPEFANAISKTLGTQVYSMEDIHTGDALTYAAYGDNGRRIVDTYYKPISKTALSL